MREAFGEAKRRLGCEIDSYSVLPTEPIAADSWVISSLLQKSIRRGETEIARRAALTLFRLRGASIWRRFMVIAFEDIGIGGVDAVTMTVAAGAGAAWRKACGGDLRVAVHVAGLLADAPKDRSADYLAAAEHHPVFAEFTQGMANANNEAPLTRVRNQALALPQRAIASCFASGLGSHHEAVGRRSDLDGLLVWLRELGAPEDLVAATDIAAARTREPITVMVPLIWLEIERGGPVRVSESAMPNTEIVDGIPLYTFDKHTRLGKRAIRELIEADAPLKSCLQEFLPRARWQAAAEMAAFYADAAPIARRLEWSLSHSVEALGTEADFFKVGAPLAAIQPLQGAMAAALAKLNEIRKALWIKARASVGASG
jgi:hypothetical protein